MSVPHQVEDIQRFLMHPLRKDKMHLVHLPPGSAFLGIPVFPCQVLPLAQHLPVSNTHLTLPTTSRV